MRDCLKHILFFAFLFNCLISVHAQNESEPRAIPVPFKFYKTKTAQENISKLIENEGFFISPISASGKIEAGAVFWVRADFSGLKDTLKTGRWFLNTGSHLEITAFSREGRNITEKKFGYLNGKNDFHPNEPIDGLFFTSENLIDSKYLFFKIKFFASQNHIKNLNLTLQSEKDHHFDSHYFTWPELKKETTVYLFVGAFLFIFVFSFITYFTSRRLDFLFYSLYILCLLVYLGKSAFQFDDLLVRRNALFSMWLHSVLQILINLFYVAFAKYYLETQINYPKLNKAIFYIALFLLILIPVETFFSFTFRFDAHQVLMNVHRLVMSVFAVLAFIYLLKFAKNMLAYFIIIGSFSFTAGSLAMLFSTDKTYMMAGSVFEVLLFGLGLNYKMKKSNEEKIQLKQSVFDNQISALRAQMNPHFIFNSLGSIQHLIISGKKEAAVKYLSKFSLLMRKLLEGSIEANVVLSEEITLLRKYIELEALRFDNAFRYSITMAENIEPEAIEVPSLIVQPFVENAIIHGLLNKENNDKELRVHFRKEGKFLICEIEDNGIGRLASAEKKTLSKQISHGINVAKKRLQIIAQAEGEFVEIIDKTDENGIASGTLAILKIAIE